MSQYKNDRCKVCHYGREDGSACIWFYKNNVELPPFLKVVARNSLRNKELYPFRFVTDEHSEMGNGCMVFSISLGKWDRSLGEPAPCPR